MRKRLLKLFGIALTFIIIGSVMSSCKSSHEVCPAYTNLEISEVGQF